MPRRESEPPERHRPTARPLSQGRPSKGTASRRRLSAVSCQSDLREGGAQANQSAAEMRLDRTDGTPGLTRDLRDRELAEVTVSYTHLRAHETRHDLVCRLLLEKKK